MVAIAEIHDNTFSDEVLAASGPVLLMFTAAWCGPCKMMHSRFAEMNEADFAGVKVCVMDVDKNPATAPKYNVRGIPTFLVFKDGAVHEKKVGAMDRVRIKALLERANPGDICGPCSGTGAAPGGSYTSVGHNDPHEGQPVCGSCGGSGKARKGASA
jgi:thioredoxin 1